MALTRRQQITRILRNGRVSLEDLAHHVGASVKSVLSDLEHIRRSLKAEDRWVVHAAECLGCGFVFTGRERLNTPSRCPRCRREDIRHPEFEIAGS